MKRSIIGIALGLSLFLAPLAHADTTPVPIGDPYTDTIQLWSDIASLVSLLINNLAAFFDGAEFATAPDVQTPSDSLPAAAALSANSEEATISTSTSDATSNQTTLSQNVKSAELTPAEFGPAETGTQTPVFTEATPAFNASIFVTQSELAYVLLALSTSLSTKSAPTTVPAVPLADGNPLIPYAAENNITNLSGVTISNATISGGSVPSSSLTGTIANSIDTATGEINSLSGSDLTYTAATTTNATSTNLFASNIAAGALSVSGTTTLENVILSSLNCSTFGNGGKLTTDALGTVTCAADQGGSGSTVGGSDMEVQFNSGGSFQGSSSFIFASSTNLLAVTNASTTNLTASYASSTSFYAGSATSTNLFASFANFTTGIINTLSGTQLTYTEASTTNISASGEGYFGTASTTNLTVSGAPSGFLQTNAQGAVSATSTFSAGSLFGTLASVNGTPLPANGAITVSAASSTLLGDNNAFSGVDDFTNASSNFGGTWQTFSPSHFQSAGTYLAGIGNYATTTATAISISTSTQTFDGLTFGNSFAISASGISVAPTVSGTLNNAGLAHSTIVVNGTALTLGDAGDTISAASSTLFGDSDSFSGNDSFKLISLSATSSSLLSVNASGVVVATTSIGTNLLNGALGTINGTSFSVGGSITVGSASTTLLGDNNTFSGGNLFTASTTIGNGNQNGGLIVSGGATTTGNLTIQGSGTSTFLGNIGISGNIVPSADNAYMLGSPSYEWKDVYIGPGSLFVNGQEVVHTDASQNVLLTANSNQNLEMQTSGTGSVLLNSSGTGNIQLAGPVQITGGENFSTSNATPVLFSDGVEPGNLELTGNAIQAANTNGGISFSPNGNGGTYFTNGNVGIGTTNPLSKLEVEGAVAAQNFSATSTTATSTFADGISLTSGCFSLNGTCIGSYSASSTLLGDNNAFSGVDSFTNASGSFAGTWQGLSPSHFDTFAYQFPLNATSTTLTFSDGLSAFASTTIGNGTQSGGLTISGGATTTANFLVQGTLTAQAAASIGTTLAVNGTTGTTTIASGQGFTVGGSQFVVQQGSGNVGIGTTNPSAAKLVVTGSAASPLASFTDNTDGTFSISTVGSGAGGVNLLTSAGYLNFNTDSPLTAMTILRSGNVGIGTTSPQSLLHLYSSTANVAETIQSTSGATSLEMQPASNNTYSLINLGDGATYGWQIGKDINSGGLGGANGFYIYEMDTGQLATRFAINKGGNVGIGTTNPGAPLDVNGKAVINGVSEASAAVLSDYYNGNSAWGIGVDDTAAANSSAFLYMESNGTEIGDITNVNNTGISYNTSSDIRLKENIATTTAGLATLMQIPVVDFNFISDPTQTRVQGFIAQWLYPIYPEAVTTNGTPATGPLGTSTPWAVDYGRLTPLLVTAIQDIANISSTFEQNLIAWLGNAQNGIGEFFAQVGNFQTTNTQTLCITNGSNDPSPLCITKSQLAALLSQIASAQTSESVSSSALQNPTPEIPESVSSTTPPVIQINGDNPASIQVGATYNDLGATITGPTADLNLGIETFVNGVAMSPVQIDTSSAATDTVQYVAADQNGLTSTSTRTVIVEAAETPSIVPTNDASSTTPTNDDTATTTAATSTSS